MKSWNEKYPGIFPLESQDMRRRYRINTGFLCAWCILAAPGRASAAEEPRNLSQASAWATDSVELRDGRVYSGLIESEDRAWLYLTEIHRPAGRPMYLVVRPIEQDSIVRVIRLDADARDELRGRLNHFKNRARIEAGRMQAVRLELARREGTIYRHYAGKWFSLDSSVDEDTTRRIIVRVEQVFAAYRQVLPPRTQPERPLRIGVLGSLELFRDYLRRLG